MRCFLRWLAEFAGRNFHWMPSELILEQMQEPRPLPLGRTEFMEWSDRIIAGAMIPADPTQSHETHIDSIRYALANLILHLGPTESHKPDAFFIHSLRKFAINQVADTLRKELFEAGKKRVAEKESATQKPQNDSNGITEEPKLNEKDAQVLEFRGKDGDSA